MRLLGYLHLQGVLTCETGLLIGGNDPFGIGGIDKQMIRESFRFGRPYIPGSSLKGKMRHLQEQRLGLAGHDGKGDPHTCGVPKCKVCRIFGTTDKEAKTSTRIIVRDARLMVESDDVPAYAKELPEITAYLTRVDDYQKQAGGFTESKTENVINRIKGSAQHPRHFERVPAGMKFAIDIVYKLFDQTAKMSAGKFDDTGDDTNIDLAYYHHFLGALNAVTEDYLGASGSRGYGRISLSHLRLNLTDVYGSQSLWATSLEGISGWEPWADPDLVNKVNQLAEVPVTTE